jgi:hypothetical protein
MRRRPHAIQSPIRRIELTPEAEAWFIALFAFDTRGHAVILLGGDKQGDWTRGYKRNIPVADKLYDEHLRSSGKERPWPIEALLGAGARYAGRGR